MAGNVGYYRPTGFLTISTVSAFYQELDDLKQPTAGSVGSVISRRATSAPEQGRSNQQSCRNPNPEEFTLENGRTATRERSSDTYWRYSNRSPGKKVTVMVERDKEGDSQTAVRHCVQQTMAGSRQKEIHPHRESAKIWQDYYGSKIGQ